MSTAEIIGRIDQASPRLRTRLVGIYYLLTVGTGAFILFFHGRFALTADLIASVLYLNMTAFIYTLSRRGNKSWKHPVPRDAANRQRWNNQPRTARQETH